MRWTSKSESSLSQLFETLRELSTPKLWSAGVELARTSQFVVEPSANGAELTVRLILSSKGTSPRVVLNSDTEIWQCDCTEEDDPCRHVIAVAIAERQKLLTTGTVSRSSSTTRQPGSVVYRFARQGELLSFDRILRWQDLESPITSTLSKAIDLAGRDRIVVCGRDDHSVDHVLGHSKSGVLPPNTMRLLIPALRNCAHVELNGRLVHTSTDVLSMYVSITTEKDGFRVRREVADVDAEIFKNGVARIADRLVGTADVELSAEQLKLVEGDGTFVPASRAHDFAASILPLLERRIRVDIRTNRLPRARRVSPRVVMELLTDDSHEHLTVVPRMYYGNPPIAELRQGVLHYVSPSEVPIRDASEEERLSRRLFDQLGLRSGIGSRFSGPRAVDFVSRLSTWETTGDGARVFSKPRSMDVTLNASMSGLDVSFTVNGEDSSLEFEDARQAFRRGERYIRLGNGLWCELPTEWLAEHGERIARFLAARDEEGRAPSQIVLEAAALVDETGGTIEPALECLRRSLTDLTSLDQIDLPSGFTGELRPYQLVGARWLTLLMRHQIGALLADDMGLGKTVQVLASLKPGRILIVAPASVIHGWQIQAAKFRPDLSCSIYHGSSRRIDQSDITLTTYGLLRIDSEKLSSIDWDLVVLDESQLIKNPDSQVSRASFALRAKAKISLSGTPVENDFEDLWSQFRFLNPGLLGTRTEFLDTMNSENTSKVGFIRKKVTPFILRRLKSHVAKDLPPRTEVVLECELDEEERLTYEAIAASSREEILNKLGNDAGFLSILEAILRLRQACCHIGLVPGFDRSTSSKCEVLIDSLSRSVAQGHRALVFSQWTSFLDLLEPMIAKAGLTFSRLDGSTRDRQSVVEDFQKPEGPNLMLLSLKAGGVGLTLTAADHVYILDPWWNPAVEAQAADRVHRIRQDNPVVIYKVVARGTIEERILELQERKKEISVALLDPSSKTTISRGELLELLG